MNDNNYIVFEIMGIKRTTKKTLLFFLVMQNMKFPMINL